jgi:molybdopterin-guanine dinucleotide biosynthesis protein A
MAVQQIRVPWIPGYDVGVGADVASGSPMNSPVISEATPVDLAAGSTIDIQIQRINSTQELERALAVDAEASYGCGSFGPSMSARFSFSKDSKVQSSSLFMTVTVRVQLEFLSVDTPRLTYKAAEVIANPELFEARYGNMFVRGIGRGGLFVGVLRIDTGSSEESMKISAELEGSYGLFTAEAKTKFSEVQKKYKNEVFIRQYQEGGPKGLRIDDPTDPLRLLENANTFVESFNVSTAEEASKVAVPYFVTLAPTAIAEGPLPPNPAELQHAKDVLLSCAKRRSVFLDNLNLLEYIADNATKFESADVQALREAARKFQDDLNLIAECASAAIANRASAKFPEQFAADRGSVFPSGEMPTALPTAVAPARTVLVPDFDHCTSKDECNALATQHELTTEFVPMGSYEAFKVVGTEPSKGAQAEVGSAVKIFCPPDMLIALPISLSETFLADIRAAKIPNPGA